MCEKYAWTRLLAANKLSQNNVIMKDYLIGFCENMSCVRSNSMDLVVSTNSSTESIEDFQQAISEIYRVLKEVSIHI